MKQLILLLSLFSNCSICFSQIQNISESTKKIVFTRDEGRCKCCGSSENLEYSYTIPIVCGGQNTASNIQLICKKCNLNKSTTCFCKIHNKKITINCCDSSTIKQNTISDFSKNPKSSTLSPIQCSGITKKGARCKNMTTNSSGRCHLH